MPFPLPPYFKNILRTNSSDYSSWANLFGTNLSTSSLWTEYLTSNPSTSSYFTNILPRNLSDYFLEHHFIPLALLFYELTHLLPLAHIFQIKFHVLTHELPCQILLLYYSYFFISLSTFDFILALDTCRLYILTTLTNVPILVHTSWINLSPFGGIPLLILNDQNSIFIKDILLII